MSAPVLTHQSYVEHFFLGVGAAVYYAVLLFCIGYVLYSIFMDIRDWYRVRQTKKYMQEEGPIEYILDYPGYATELYVRDEDK